MKKILVAILALFYLASSSGATIHLHYCMGKLISWSLLHAKNDRCNKCGMKKTAKSKGCCRDEQKFIKIEKDQKVQAAFLFVQLFPIITSVSFIEFSNTSFSSIAEEYPISHAPPRSEEKAIHILNCIFRI